MPTAETKTIELLPTFAGTRLFQRAKRGLKWTVPCLALIWVGWIGLVDRTAVEPGPVSMAHAMFGRDCGKCHVPAEGNLAAKFSSLAFAPVPDRACVVCHAGPDHHEPLLSGDKTRCVQCHREHTGHAPLAHVADSQCTNCHADLNFTARGANPSFVTSIDSWSSHPEFALLRPTGGGMASGPAHGMHQVAELTGGKWLDRTRIRFNHKVHLASPQAVAVEFDGSVQPLACNDCHQPDRASGYMLPIKHEDHCASCHRNALLFDEDLFPGQPVPHVDAAQVRGALRELYAGARAKDQQPRQPEPVLPTMRVSREDQAWIDSRVDDASGVMFKERDANRLLFEQKGTGCRYCHVGVNLTDGQWHVAAADIPDRWFAHSVFRHNSHRMLSCVECHDRVTPSTDTSDILLPGIVTCKKCHQASGLFQFSSSSARTDCAECHEYHRHQGENFDGPLGANLQDYTRTTPRGSSP